MTTTSAISCVIQALGFVHEERFHEAVAKASKATGGQNRTLWSSVFSATTLEKQFSVEYSYVVPGDQENNADNTEEVRGVLHFQASHEKASRSPVVYYRIQGSGSDKDGSFQIVEGRLSPYTGAMYWIQEPDRSNESLTPMVLVSGTARRLDRIVAGQETTIKETQEKNDTSTAFHGKWHASNGTKGGFESFHFRLA
ncbi:expressed unknown protein [Seminavis robusta]|uniref:Uncharacterized protein n=1 Tax=Seminavis robusta TaxID=568900 RepID=A0A9N8H7K1_9STRA|nr:expressed unknown protein [Seminavis robusta]|eukprot:Sro132_g062420.1 n/a (197) ;mRNA; f:15160-15750